MALVTVLFGDNKSHTFNGECMYFDTCRYLVKVCDLKETDLWDLMDAETGTVLNFWQHASSFEYSTKSLQHRKTYILFYVIREATEEMEVLKYVPHLKNFGKKYPNFSIPLMKTIKTTAKKYQPQGKPTNKKQESKKEKQPSRTDNRTTRQGDHGARRRD